MADVKKIATREAYGEFLVEEGAKRPNLVVMDADLSGSTKTKNFAKAFPERFVNCGISEQDLYAEATGIALSGHVVCASTFAMFAAGRAYEIIRNSIGYTGANVKICATHAGITVGEDGASHQTFEDLSLMREIPGMTVLCPADAVSARKLLEAAVDQLGGLLRHSLGTALKLLAVVLLCGLAEGLYGGMGVSQTTDVVAIVGALAITAVAVADANSLIGMGREALEQMEIFSKILLPTITAAAAAAGSPSGAVARQLATMLFSDILITLINRLLLPLVYTYIAACVAYAAVGNEGLKKLASVLKWVVTSLLTAVLLAFVGYLTASGAIAGSADAAAIKTAKMAISRAVPVVGGILADAAETVLVGAGVLRGTVGIVGMLGVLAICLIPFLQLAFHYLTYKLAAALIGTVSDKRLSDLLDSIGGAFGIVLGMTGACALMLLVSLASAVKAVTP